ncbi:MAG: mevalonate kinase, partial [Alphaproteobacteria bacterium]
CAAARAAGALGARITGAGFGGCFIALATPQTAQAVLASVATPQSGAWLVSRIDA